MYERKTEGKKSRILLWRTKTPAYPKKERTKTSTGKGGNKKKGSPQKRSMGRRIGGKARFVFCLKGVRICRIGLLIISDKGGLKGGRGEVKSADSRGGPCSRKGDM